MTNLSGKSIALTGHTSGIGNALFLRLRALGFNVRGFSRSNGYDITAPARVTLLLSEVEDCSIFINNASQDWAQLDLLYELFSKWKDQDKLILNIGSNSGDGDKNRAYKYAIEKSALDKATAQLNNIGDAKCRVSTIRPGWVKTPRVAHLNLKETMLTADDVADVVVWMLNMPKHIHVQNITFTPKNCD